MLNGINIWTNDKVWRKILIDMGATVASDHVLADINFDDLNVSEKLSSMQLKAVILSHIEEQHKNIIQKVFKKNIVLPALQLRIVMLLFKTGGMSATDLKTVLGYAPDAMTHVIDTAIYQLRKEYGRDFIINENGKYIIGQL